MKTLKGKIDSGFIYVSICCFFFKDGSLVDDTETRMWKEAVVP